VKRLEINYSLGAMDALVSLARYNFVCRTVNDKGLSVLDFGCGSGYGTKVLKESFSRVDAFDEYPDGYNPADEFITSLEELKGRQYDIVTCFEVIEHMDAAAQEVLLDNLRSLLKPGGLLFISTVRKMDPPPTENRRIEHIKELTFDELYSICKKRFPNVLTFGQIDQVISTFYKENCYHFLFICIA
jgi:2-polyprenyl-3-methyl-5-hydroxy-6-metoxy-1,4-benzoquinol methylase